MLAGVSVKIRTPLHYECKPLSFISLNILPGYTNEPYE
jgi:hypothetical protein